MDQPRLVNHISFFFLEPTKVLVKETELCFLCHCNFHLFVVMKLVFAVTVSKLVLGIKKVYMMSIFTAYGKLQQM